MELFAGKTGRLARLFSVLARVKFLPGSSSGHGLGNDSRWLKLVTDAQILREVLIRMGRWEEVEEHERHGYSDKHTSSSHSGGHHQI